jgi:nucleoside-diphosphate-sugar epimerase
MTKKVLILGATGKVGKHSAKAFEAAGWDVKLYDRRSIDMAAAAQGCDVIVNGLNPPNYHDWKTIIPEITRQVIDAAQKSGATVILPGNVYHFGDQGGEWSETTPARPVSRKGQIRLDMERAYAHSGVQTLVLRAGNWIDPDQEDCVMTLVYLRDIKSGKITCPGPADVRQAMAYLPDWAQAAVALAERRETLGQFEDIPFEGYSLTANDIKTNVEKVLKRDLKIVGFPWVIFRIAAPVWELARELGEMRYLWNTDHALSSRKLRSILPNFQPTPVEDAFRAYFA